MGAPPFPVKKRQKLLLFDFLWVKNGTKKRTALGQFSLPVMYGYEKFSDPFPDGSAAHIGNFDALSFQIVTDLICLRKVFRFFRFIPF